MHVCWRSTGTCSLTIMSDKIGHRNRPLSSRNICILLFFVQDTVKPVLETTGIKRPPALRDHCSDTTALLNPSHTTNFGLLQTERVCR